MIGPFFRRRGFSCSKCCIKILKVYVIDLPYAYLILFSIFLCIFSYSFTLGLAWKRELPTKRGQFKYSIFDYEQAVILDIFLKTNNLRHFLSLSSISDQPYWTLMIGDDEALIFDRECMCISKDLRKSKDN